MDESRPRRGARARARAEQQHDAAARARHHPVRGDARRRPAGRRLGDASPAAARSSPSFALGRDFLELHPQMPDTLARFCRCFNCLELNDPKQWREREALFVAFSSDGNTVSRNELSSGIRAALARAYGVEAIPLFQRYATAFGMAFDDAKDVAAAQPELHLSAQDECVTRNEFRVLCVYLRVYATWYDVFARVAEGMGSRAATATPSSTVGCGRPPSPRCASRGARGRHTSGCARQLQKILTRSSMCGVAAALLRRHGTSAIKSSGSPSFATGLRRQRRWQRHALVESLASMSTYLHQMRCRRMRGRPPPRFGGWKPHTSRRRAAAARALSARSRSGVTSSANGKHGGSAHRPTSRDSVQQQRTPSYMGFTASRRAQSERKL